MSGPRRQRLPRCRALLALALAAALGGGASFALGGAAAATSATGGSDSSSSSTGTTVCPPSNPPNELTLVGGTPQTAKLGTAFSDSFQVVLANSDGCPLTTQVAGTGITFTAPSSGASGTFAATGSNTVTVGADTTGTGSAPMFTANDAAGSYTVTASSDYGSVSFALTNTATGTVTSIAPLAPAKQSATVDARYSRALQVKVLDANGDPVQGAEVTFTLGSSSGGGDTSGGGTSGGGTASAGASFVGGSTQATETTNADGIATSPALVANDTAGAFTASATIAGTTKAASFSLDNLAGKPPRLVRVGAARRAATVDRRYSRPLEAKVLDAEGKPLEGQTVTFTLGSSSGGGGTSGGGTASAGASFVGGSTQATETTNADGIATSPALVANDTAGAFTATATIAGTTKAASFSLDNLAGKPPRLVRVGAARRAATVDRRYSRPLEAKVLDAEGKPLEGQTVTFTLGSSSGGGGTSGGGTASAGASFVGGSTQATETTNADGIATSPRFEANTTAGSFTATATATGSTDAASFTLRNRAGTPATIAAGAAADESTVAGSRFPVRLAVTVTDKDGNPVAGALVRFSAPRSGPGGRFEGKKRTAWVRTDAKGIAVAPAFVANRTPGGYVVTARVTHAGSAAFALINQPAS